MRSTPPCLCVFERAVGVFSPWVLGSQFLLGGEQLDAVLQLKEGLLLGLVLHALVLVKVLLSVTQTHITAVGKTLLMALLCSCHAPPF